MRMDGKNHVIHTELEVNKFGFRNPFPQLIVLKSGDKTLSMPWRPGFWSSKNSGVTFYKVNLFVRYVT